MIEKALRREQDEGRIVGHGAQRGENRHAKSLHISPDQLPDQELMLRCRTLVSLGVPNTSMGQLVPVVLQEKLQRSRGGFRSTDMKYEFRVEVGALQPITDVLHDRKFRRRVGGAIQTAGSAKLETPVELAIAAGHCAFVGRTDGRLQRGKLQCRPQKSKTVEVRMVVQRLDSALGIEGPGNHV